MDLSWCCSFIKNRKGGAANGTGASRPNFIQRMESRIEDNFVAAKDKLLTAERAFVQEQEANIKAKVQKYSETFHNVEEAAKHVVEDGQKLVNDAKHMDFKAMMDDVKNLEHDMEEVVDDIKDDFQAVEQDVLNEAKEFEQEVKNEVKGDVQKIVTEIQHDVRSVREIPINSSTQV